MYPPTTSESSARDSYFESSTGPSRKRCRSFAATVTSSIHATRALVLSWADLLPPLKRFRDYISPKDSVEKDIDTDVLEDIEADATAIEDEVEDEVRSSDRGTVEVGVDVAAGIDIPDGMLMPDAMEHLEHVKEGLQDVYEHEALTAYEATRATNALEAKIKSKMVAMATMEMVEMEMVKMEMEEIENQIRIIWCLAYCSRVYIPRFHEVSTTQLEGNRRSCQVDKRTIGTDDAFAMSWRELIKLMAEVAYYDVHQMVPEEEDRVEKFIGGYAIRNAENKRKFNNIQKDNCGQQSPNKRHNVGGQNVARAYTTGNNKRGVYNRPLPLYNKCKFHHEGPCTMRCGKCVRNTKNTLVEYMILSGADNRPPMLDKDLYDSWKIRMELYMQNKEHERMILKSVKHGSLICPTIEENREIGTKKYAELSAVEKIQADCDMKETNINNLIACLNKAMAFLIVVASSRILSTNNQLRASSNPKKAIIQDGRVIVQQVQGRQGQSYSGTGYKSHATSFGGYNASGHAREKAMLAEAQEAGKILDEEQLAFLVDLGVPDEVPHSKTYLNDMENQSVLAMQDFEQPPVVDSTDNEIHYNSNIIQDLLNEIMEVHTVFDQMDAVVQQSLVNKQCLEIAKKELLLENDRILQQIMSQDVLLTMMNSMSLIGDTVNKDGNTKESSNLEAELLKSQNAFNNLLKSH
nr:hypothetical protein [Tanacetum cinerariifolium]